jgi:hypothetical protein
MAKYSQKDREVKKRARSDKRTRFKDKVAEAETAATMGDNRTMYRIVKMLSGDRPYLSETSQAIC